MLEIADGKWRFSHDKLRESLLSTLPTDDIPRLNREVAEAIELVYPHDDRRAAVLCEHWATANCRKRSPLCAAGRGTGTSSQCLSEALRYYARAQQIYGAQILRTTHTGSAICLIGSAHVFLVGDLPQAIVYFNKSQAHAAAIGDPAIQATALVGLGDIKLLQGQFQAARTDYEQGLTLARALGVQEVVAMALSGLGDCVWRMAIRSAHNQYWKNRWRSRKYLAAHIRSPMRTTCWVSCTQYRGIAPCD